MTLQPRVLSKIMFSAVAIMAAGMGADANAQGAGNYPNRAMRWVVGYTPGGTADMLARAVGAKFNESWGQAVIVENRPGAATNIGTEIVARAAPDGHTLLITASAAIAINPNLFPRLGFDVARDLAPVAQGVISPLIWVVHPSLQVRTLADLVAYGSNRYQATGPPL